MKTDKAALVYAGKTQTECAFDMLSAHCDKVFVSNREDQANAPGRAGLPQIHDSFQDLGPMGGILSAMTAYPGVAWLVLSCDLPYLDNETLRNLIARRNRAKPATAYASAHDGLPEPLCAIYEPAARETLLRFVDQGIHCPRKAMIRSDIELLKPVNPHALDNINTPEEHQDVLRHIGP